MSIEFIGSLVNASAQNSFARSGGTDADYPARMARLHEESGFDRLLVGHSSSSPDGFTVADTVLNATSRLGVLLAHRPGFVAPTVAARQYATLDAFHPGRVALHVISGGDDADQLRDGDTSDKAARYRRSDEFLDIVKLEWSSAAPFDYEGEFYRVRGALSSVRPADGALPVYFAGASAEAVLVGGRQADVYAFWGEPLAAIELARGAEKGSGGPGAAFDHKGSLGSLRLAQFADQAEIHDKRLWTPLAKTPTAAGNSTALVGSYEQIADALLDYVAIGVSTLLIRGYDPEGDATDYARIIKLVRDQEPALAGVTP
jgi:alkanesulfonate monooxygenase